MGSTSHHRSMFRIPSETNLEVGLPLSIAADDIIAIATIISSLVGGAIHYERKINQVYRHYDATLQTITDRLTALETKIDPFWDLIRVNLPKLFKTNPPNATLIRKLSKGIATHDELLQLQRELRTGLNKTNAKLVYLFTLTLVEIELKKNELDLCR